MNMNCSNAALVYDKREVNMKFNEVQVLDEPRDKVEIIKDIIKTKRQEDAFYILDVGDIINKQRTWREKFPRVEPHFAIKCNPDPTVVRTLAGLKVGFDCASKPAHRNRFQNVVTGIGFARVGVTKFQGPGGSGQ